MSQQISKKIALLNETTLDSLVERDVLKIIQNFTDIGLKILEADFGFAWWLTPEKTKYHLIYKSPNTPYEPELPRERGGNFEAQKTRKPFFVEQALKEKYEEGYDVSIYMRSYVIIPITHAKNIYGSIVLCFKNQHVFSEVDRQLAASIGNAAAQSITINNLIEKEHQNILVSARQEARLEEERIRTEFIVNATHEIRTPLAIIRGNADIALMKKDLSTSAKSAFKAIEHEVEHLSLMISDLAMLTSVDAIVKEAVFAEVNLREIITTVAQRYATLAHKKNITIKVSQGKNDLIVMGDRIQLERLFLNLVKNSVTYGKKGGWIKIEAEKNKDQALIKVSDNGIGISEKDLPKVFNRFFRAEKSRWSDEGSTGLGLAIVRLIAKVHRGEISVESTLDKGSCFTVSIPLKH